MRLQKLLLVIIITIIANNSIVAQCTYSIANLPDTILACKNTIVNLNPSIQLNGNTPYFIDTFWTPTTGISNPNILNPSINVATTSNNYILTVQSVTASNLITNGDFSLGNSIFTSAYGLGSGGSFGLLSTPGEYAISTNPSLTHINFSNFGDHTTGTGNMMVVNGASTPNVNVWCQTITVLPNTFYDFSAWGTSVDPASPAILQFSINGTLIGTPLALSATTGLWSQFRATWFSGTNTSITICITDQATSGSGNDFAIDDIAFRQICNVQDSVYIDVVNLTPAISNFNKFGCNQDTVVFNANSGVGNIPTGYAWYFGDGGADIIKSPSHIYANQGTYTVKLVTELKGCKDSTIKNISVSHPLSAIFSVDDTLCVGQQANIINTSITSLVTTTQINWGDGIINNNLFHTYSNPGVYTVTMILKDFINCYDSTKQNIVVQDGPAVAFAVVDTILCQGEPMFCLDTINQYTTQYVWDFGDGVVLSNVHHPVHTYTTSGSYNVTLIGKNGKCPDVIANQLVKVNQLPIVNLGADTSYCEGLTGNIPLDVSNTISTDVLWSNGLTGTKKILVSDPGNYWVEVTNDGCISSDTIFIKRDCFIVLPNSFTPGADGLNEYFMPRDISASGMISFSFNIFNRWGENIFNTTNINGRGWDGKYGDKAQPMGVYVYQINAIFKNGQRKNFTGNVTLLR
jgi:gliding motility-associated-like protein